MNMLSVAVDIIEKNALCTRIFSDVLENSLPDIIA